MQISHLLTEINSFASFCTHNFTVVSFRRSLFPHTEDRGSSIVSRLFIFYNLLPTRLLSNESVSWKGLDGPSRSLPVWICLRLKLRSSFQPPQFCHYGTAFVSVLSPQTFEVPSSLSPYFPYGPFIFFSQLWMFRFILLSNLLL